MTKSVNYATRDFSVAPGATVQIVRQARQVACLAASSTFRIAFDDGSESDFEAGLTYSPEAGFTRILIRNPGAQTLTVTLGIGSGSIRDARVTINAGVTLPVREVSPEILTTGAAIIAATGAATEAAAANALRREIMLVNTDAAATVYACGSATAAAGEGLPILPGQSLTLESSAAIYLRNDSGAAVAVAVAEMGWSA